MQNYTNNANGDVPLALDIFSFSKFKVQSAHMFFWREKQNWAIVFFMKIFFIL